MNRIRKYRNTFQVLVTPHQKYNVGFEFMLGSWTDEGLAGFEVKEYDTYYEAECEALQHPDINWDQLVAFHTDAYQFLKMQIQDVINNSKMAVQFKSKLLTPDQTKNTMFDRVLSGQKTMNENNSMSGFRPVYNMNDIISFCISNPWSHNLIEFERRLLRESRLNIFNRLEKNCFVRLIGRTDIGTTYEILLVPTILHNWLEWKSINQSCLLPAHQMSELKNCIQIQNLIDSTRILR